MAFSYLSSKPKILSRQDAKILVQAYVTSRLNDFISLFSSYSNKILKTLQLIWNAGASIQKKKQYERPYFPGTRFSPLAPC